MLPFWGSVPIFFNIKKKHYCISYCVITFFCYFFLILFVAIFGNTKTIIKVAIQNRKKKKEIYSPFTSKYHKSYTRNIPPQHQQAFQKTVNLYNSMIKESWFLSRTWVEIGKSTLRGLFIWGSLWKKKASEAKVKSSSAFVYRKLLLTFFWSLWLSQSLLS